MPAEDVEELDGAGPGEPSDTCVADVGGLDRVDPAGGPFEVGHVLDLPPGGPHPAGDQSHACGPAGLSGQGGDLSGLVPVLNLTVGADRFGPGGLGQGFIAAPGRTDLENRA